MNKSNNTDSAKKRGVRMFKNKSAIKSNEWSAHTPVLIGTAILGAMFGVPLAIQHSQEKKLAHQRVQYVNAFENKVKEYIANGGDVNAQDKAGQTLLLKAIRLRNNVLANELIKAGADVNKADNKGVTPLMAAVLHSNEDMFKVLIETDKIDVNKKDNDGFTALMVCLNSTAVCFNGETAINKLIALGADVNAQTLEGTTPLMICAACGNYGMYSNLLKKGANAIQQDVEGKTAVDYALLSNREHMYEYIQRMEREEQFVSARVKTHKAQTVAKERKEHSR